MATSCTDRNGDRWDVYETTAGWRWRRTASNGRIVAASTEAYSSRQSCISNAQRCGMTCTPVEPHPPPRPPRLRAIRRA